MNERTLHTLIAALRFWQLHEGQHPAPLVDMASNDGEVDPLSSKEIDDLIENHLNAGGADPDSWLSVKREGFGVAVLLKDGMPTLIQTAGLPAGARVKVFNEVHLYDLCLYDDGELKTLVVPTGNDRIHVKDVTPDLVQIDSVDDLMHLATR
ncbi:hypothetical protein EHI8A_145660 [Entamoeba histolytica HM-1:IMSS-B]|jgi:hypothetical protein|uniref:Uncharacterized protein n=2 Tax=cellular organisms TaxID=131567 RepID=A0A178LN97_9PSED|nr:MULTISPECIES: hypothetical protein [Pseudomonas]EMH74942.1 hypothetical protein EHI8A_145660 [Entamoeba histolytica HM-1:IMSS-B]NRH44588.1 hypothetical protein [Pseudomonas sp. MS15a(2019)]OAN31802.1 hypothetical protein A4V15_12140 [Pseudomonas oryzihabitans]